MTASSSVYVHGTDAPEQFRLAALNDILNQRTLEEIDVVSGQRILDVGSGLGQLAVAMSRQAGPSGCVLGIERSEEQLEQARRSALNSNIAGGQVEFRQGDALRLPLTHTERGTFDCSVTRFVLEHVPDPLAVVRQMVLAVRPGGRIILADDDHDVLRLYPAPAGLDKVWGAYMRLYEKIGNDAFVGRKLVQLLHQAGAMPRRNKWIWFGACSGDPTFVPLIENMIAILDGARDRMLEHGLVAEADFCRCQQALRDFASRPDAALWFAMAYAEGVRPK